MDTKELLDRLRCPGIDACPLAQTRTTCTQCQKTVKKEAAEVIEKLSNGAGWISVEERLPDKDGDYLVFKRFAGNAWSDVVSFAKDGRKVSECAFGEKWQNVWYYYDSEWGYIRTDAVTHWMQLPSTEGLK